MSLAVLSATVIFSESARLSLEIWFNKGYNKNKIKQKNLIQIIFFNFIFRKQRNKF
jgi:hypothetical protein